MPAALTSNQRDGQVERMRRAYDERRIHIVERLSAIPGIRCVLPKGAFYVMMDMSALIGRHCGEALISGSMAFAEQLLEHADVAVVPGDAFCTEGFCRLSYATSMEAIDKGIDRIAAFVGMLK